MHKTKSVCLLYAGSTMLQTCPVQAGKRLGMSASEPCTPGKCVEEGW